MTRRYIRSKRSTEIRAITEKEAERLRNELQTAPAAVKPDELIVANASASAITAHTHTASNITDFNTAADARITNAVGVTVQAKITAGSAIADASGGATVDTEARAALNSLLAMLRTQGLLST
jgi:hypothetical protein